MKKQLIALTALLATTLGAFAQDLTIASGGINACGGSLNDSNPVGPYGPNENFTFTLCPELGSGETISNIYFIGFSLGAGDTLRAYDGGSNGDPLIGVYTGTDLANQNLTSTNAEGCITLVWTSDATEEGDFGAILSCGPPCIHPVINVTAEGETTNPIRICQGESLNFNGSETTFAPGNTLASWTWDFGDGSTDNSQWPFVTHVYNTPGAYKIGLVVTDNTGCQNLNVADVVVQVSTTPSFNLTVDPTIVCVGSEATLQGTVTGTSYAPPINSDLGGAVYIPDAGSVDEECFFDTLFINSFPPGTTIDSPSDISNFMANMEHSFLTDFTIAFICPNGQTLSVHQQNGTGGVFLGVPVDDESGTQGVGYDYFWSPEVTSPTFGAASSDPNYTENVTSEIPDEFGAFTTGNALISGTYASQDPWTNLVGCPANGPWVIRMCDVVPADDGWIFGWGMAFDASLYGDDLSFTPEFGDDCTSTFWSGNSLTNLEGCDSATVVSNTPGIQTYTYTGVDNFGCTYSSTINVTVIAPPVANAGPEVGFCGTNAQLDGSFTGGVAGQSYSYSWAPADMFDNATAEDPNIFNVTENTSVTLTVSWDNDPTGCASTDQTIVYLPAVPVAYNDTLVKHCPDGFVTLGVPFQNGPMNYSWEMSADPDFDDPEDVEIATTESVTVRTDSTAYYRVTITDPYCGYTEETYYTVLMKPCSVSAPNVFTPDGDGKNNLLVFPGLEDYPGSKLIIYNRWGTVVYETENYNNKWAPSADDAADGTYFYVLAVNKDSGLDYFKGTISVLRKDSNQ